MSNFVRKGTEGGPPTASVLNDVEESIVQLIKPVAVLLYPVIRYHLNHIENFHLNLDTMVFFKLFIGTMFMHYCTRVLDHKLH